MSKSLLSVAALRFELTPGQREVQVLPAGEFRSRDGRPEGVKAWRCNAENAAEVIRNFEARKTQLAIDYEHQTLYAETNGQKAPASGWFVALKWREGEGLFGEVDWTTVAADHIDKKEYKYFSPVFRFDKKTGDVQELMVSALTNDPGIDGMHAVALRFSHQQQEHDVDLLQQLIAALGLPAATSEKDAVAGVVALKAKADASASEVTALKAKVAEGDTQIAALKANTTNPDPSKFVPIKVMTDLQTEVAALRARVDGSELDTVVEQAQAAGKLHPSQVTWARELGATNLAALKSFVEGAPVVAKPGSLQSGGKPPAGGDAKSLDDGELAVCKALGVSQEDFIKAKKEGDE